VFTVRSTWQASVAVSDFVAGLPLRSSGLHLLIASRYRLIMYDRRESLLLVRLELTLCRTICVVLRLVSTVLSVKSFLFEVNQRA